MTHARREEAVHVAHAGFARPVRNVAALGIEHAMKVADFGAGSGAYVQAIAEYLEGSGTVYAIDVQKDLLRRIHTDATKRGLKNVEIVWGDVEAPQGSKIASDMLDLVLVSNLLFQIDDKKKVVAEGKRILKPGGRLAVIDWSESFRGMGPSREMIVTKEDAYALAREAGLSFQKEFSAGAHHYGLIFKKASGKQVKMAI